MLPLPFVALLELVFLTGKNQFRWDIPASWGPGLPDNVKTLPEYLKEVGYHTARIGKNDLGRELS